MKNDLPETSPGPRESLGHFLSGWDRFWFSPADPTTLGLIRLGTGLVLLYIQFSYCFDLLSYVSPDRGWLTEDITNYMRHDMPAYAPAAEGWATPNDSRREEIGKGTYLWSIFYHLRDPRALWAAHLGIMLVTLLFTIGLGTRVTSVLAWAGSLCYIHRTPTLLFGMDTMSTILLTYLMIGPSGAALSVDGWLRRRRDPTPARPQVSANLAIRLMQVHFCFVYLASGLSKLMGASWWNGTALWYCLANATFAPVEFGPYGDLLVFLCRHRLLWEIVMTASAVFTLVLEIGLPFLVWVRSLRWLCVTGAVLLHTGIGMAMGLITFSLLMILLVSSFIPPEAVKEALGRIGQALRGKGDAAPAARPREAAPALARAR
jgi:hypothetical protein